MNSQQNEALIRAVRAIAHGPTEGPTGLELLAMSLSAGGDASVASAIRDVAEAIKDLSISVQDFTLRMDQEQE